MRRIVSTLVAGTVLLLPLTPKSPIPASPSGLSCADVGASKFCFVPPLGSSQRRRDPADHPRDNGRVASLHDAAPRLDLARRLDIHLLPADL